MNTTKLLKSKNLSPQKAVLNITIQQALDDIAEAIQIYCPNLILEKLSKKEIESLLDSYAESIIYFHPEHYHQERACLLENHALLKKYGLTEKEIECIDFW